MEKTSGETRHNLGTLNEIEVRNTTINTTTGIDVWRWKLEKLALPLSSVELSQVLKTYHMLTQGIT